MKVAMDDYPGFHKRMSRLREMEIGLDGSICADGGEVKVHLPYIAACNQTLFNRITGLMKQGKTELTARNMSLRGIQLMIDYCYTGELEITEDNFEHIVDAALGLEFLNVVEQCVQFALGPHMNANIWCHFLRAAFKHPRAVQPNNFVPDLILQYITKIPRDAVIKGLSSAYIGEILEHGTFDDSNKAYIVNLFLEMLLADKSDIKIHKDTVIRIRDKMGQIEKCAIPTESSRITVMPLLELSLEIEFVPLVEACVEALETALPDAKVTSQVLKWAKQYDGSESGIYLNKMCYHAYRNVPLDICEDDFCLMLSSNCLGQSREIDIHKKAVKWIEHNNPDVEIKRRIVGLIRFGLMTKGEMDEIFRSHLVRGCEMESIAAMQYHLSPYDAPLAERNMNKPRQSQPQIYILGGLDEAQNYNTKVIKSQQDEQQHGKVSSLSPFTELDETPFALSDSACAEINGFIFVSGGQGELGPVNVLFRLDSRTKIWLELQKMGQKRHNHTLTLLGDVLVAIGGSSQGKLLSSVEGYDIKNNTWTVMDPIHEKRAQHAASCLDDVLYMSGGSDSKTLFGFCDNAWKEKCQMLHVRQSHTMSCVPGKLIVLGGAAKTNNSWQDVMSTECYDVIQDQWTLLNPPKRACNMAGSARLNSWIYVFGGYSQEQNSSVKVVQRYNFESNEWELCQVDLPSRMSRMVASCT